MFFNNRDLTVSLLGVVVKPKPHYFSPSADAPRLSVVFCLSGDKLFHLAQMLLDSPWSFQMFFAKEINYFT